MKALLIHTNREFSVVHSCQIVGTGTPSFSRPQMWGQHYHYDGQLHRALRVGAPLANLSQLDWQLRAGPEDAVLPRLCLLGIT